MREWHGRAYLSISMKALQFCTAAPVTTISAFSETTALKGTVRCHLAHLYTGEILYLMTLFADAYLFHLVKDF